MRSYLKETPCIPTHHSNNMTQDRQRLWNQTVQWAMGKGKATELESGLIQVYRCRDHPLQSTIQSLHAYVGLLASKKPEFEGLNPSTLCWYIGQCQFEC